MRTEMIMIMIFIIVDFPQILVFISITFLNSKPVEIDRFTEGKVIYGNE